MPRCNECGKVVTLEERTAHTASHFTAPLDRLLKRKDHATCLKCHTLRTARNSKFCRACLEDEDDQP